MVSVSVYSTGAGPLGTCLAQHVVRQRVQGVTQLPVVELMAIWRTIWANGGDFAGHGNDVSGLSEPDGQAGRRCLHRHDE